MKIDQDQSNRSVVIYGGRNYGDQLKNELAMPVGSGGAG